MRFFTLSKIASLILRVGMIEVFLGLALAKIYPQATDRLYTYSSRTLAIFFLLMIVMVILALRKGRMQQPYIKEKVHPNGIRTISLENAPESPHYVVGCEVLIGGLIMSFLPAVVGPTFDNLYPNPYLYWGNLGAIASWFFVYLILLRIVIALGIDLKWKPPKGNKPEDSEETFS